MKVIGTVFKIYQAIAGTSDNGNTWVRQTAVIETADSQSKKLAFTIMGEKRVYDWEDIKEGDLVEVAYEPRSREHEGKWFSELNAFGVKKLEKV